MSGHDDEVLAEVLHAVLHAAVDGDFLMNCKGGEDVGLQTAGIADVVWWAVHAVEPVMAARDARVAATARADALREVLAGVDRIAATYSCPPLENRANTFILREIRALAERLRAATEDPS